jgi:hypothetical protein
MPRKSAAELAVVPIKRAAPQRIEAPSGISAQERKLFNELVADCPPMQFTQSDSRLLLAYVQSCLLAKAAFRRAEEDDRALGLWEKCIRAQTTLALRLRLCPSARVDPKTLARAHDGRQLRQYGGASRETIDLIAVGASVGREWLPRG